MKPDLRELQKWMRWIVTDPRGVTAALADPHPANRGSRYQAPSADLRAAFQAPAGIATRLDIYAEAYFARILESLRLDFVMTCRLLGEEDFARFITDYLKEYPSRSFTLGDVGRHLADFAHNSQWERTYPALAAVADLEWRALKSFYAENTRPLDPAKILTIPEEAWPGVRLRLHPAVDLIESDWNLDELWNASLEDRPLPPPVRATGPTCFLLTRPQGIVRVETIESDAACCLRSLGRGLTLAETLAEFGKTGEAEQEDRLTTWFGDWVAKAVIQDVITS